MAFLAAWLVSSFHLDHAASLPYFLEKVGACFRLFFPDSTLSV